MWKKKQRQNNKKREDEESRHINIELFSTISNIDNILFCSVQKGMSKKLPLNERAASLAQAAGYNETKFYGDAFIAKIFDDQDAWERIEATAHNHEGAEDLINQFVGQVVGQMNSVRSCRAVIEDMVQEYVDTQERLNQWAEVD